MDQSGGLLTDAHQRSHWYTLEKDAPFSASFECISTTLKGLITI